MTSSRNRVLHITTVVLRVLVGLVFVYAAYVKLRDPWALFAMSIDSYGILPLRWVEFVARTLPWFEMLLGVWLILSPFALGFAAAATWMTVVFWAAGYHVCRGGVYRSVLFGGVGRASPRAGFAHGTLGGWLRAGVGDGEQCDIRSAGDPVRSLGTGDGSRVYYEVARSLASSAT